MVSVQTFLRWFNRGGRHELIFGSPRQTVPLSPDHTALVQRVYDPLTGLLSDGDCGHVLTGSVDLVLAHKDCLVLHPPLVVVLAGNRGLLRSPNCVWGAPDIVLEVLTPQTARRTRHTRVRWYRNWGVRECWLLDTRTNRFEVLNQFQDVPYIFSGSQSIESSVLPDFRPTVNTLFAESDNPAGPE